jgi:predicted ATPase
MHALDAQEGRRSVGVALAGVSSPELVLGEVAAALGVTPAGNVDAAAAIADRMQHDDTVLVLDNFEHVVAAAPAFGDLLDRCPNVQILVTSQVALRLRAERALSLRPLPVPEPGACDLAALTQLASVEIYCERAAAVDRTFTLHEGNATAVAELCRRLEGLPLAIELAAARAATLPASEILRRYATSIDLLRRPHRVARRPPNRHRPTSCIRCCLPHRR